MHNQIFWFQIYIISDVAFPEKYFAENFGEIFRRLSIEPEKYT